MSAIQLAVTRAAASTVLITDLSIDAADAGVILDALYGGASGTPAYHDKDSRALRTLCEARIGAANTQAFFAALSLDY
jgi:hypothetical protein